MSHQDDVHLRKNISTMKEMLENAVPDSVTSFVRHGNAQLEPAWLASVAMTCWGWTSDGTLAERVSKACIVVGEVLDCKKTVTRQGLLKALGTCGPQIVDLMIRSLIDQVKSLKGYWTQKGKVNIAVDGSKFAAPRTAENEAYFAATGTPKKKGKKYKKASDRSKATTVQILLTVFWHMQSGLPLQWMTSASNGSERRNAAQMLDDLPRNARLIGDAEYVGYPLWSKIHNSGRSFLVRVGSNMTFFKQLGKYRVEDGFVYYWPEGVMRANDPPLVLRLIQIHDGEKAIFLVTNELDMDDALACELYSGRWKIEMFFRTVKQTCERAKLHCHRPENVLTELNWTLLGIWYALFTGKEVLLDEGLNPTEVSPVKVMTAISKAVDEIYIMATPISLLRGQLAQAVLEDESDRTSNKASRNFPRKKKHRRCGAPKIEPAPSIQQERAKILRV